MDVVSVCALRVGELRWVLSHGAPALTVVCKATFVLQPGEAALSPQQDAIAADDAYWSEGGERALSAFSDLVPFKTRADVVITGHAHAPQGRPARVLVARAVVGAMDKAIEVHPDRFFLPSGELREGPPWAKQRLGWDRAAGGPDTANPAGMRFDAQDAHGNTPLPTLQPPGSHVARRGDTFAPACFAPIPPGWPARVYKLYRHGRALVTRDWTARPLPEDIDRGFFNVAPPDQQLPELRADERIALENLHPEHPRLVTRLPGIEPAATVARPGRAPSALALTCDTLWIDADRGTCSLVWRGTIPLAHPSEAGQVTISMEHAKPSQAGAGAPGAAQRPRPMTVQAMDALTAQEALPFARSNAPRDSAPSSSPGGASSGAALPFRTGLHALRDLPSSPVTGMPPSPGGAPGTTPAPRAPEPDATGRMPRMTVDLSGGAAALGLTPPPGILVPSAQPPAMQPPAVPPSMQVPSAQPPAMQPPAVPPPARQVPAGVPAPARVSVAPAEPAPVGGLGSGGGWSAGAPDRRPAQGSIGERLATDQAMEARLAQERRGSDEPERVGPLARPQPVSQEAAAAPSSRETGPKRAAPGGVKDALVLLWLDPASVPRMRKKPAFRDLLDALEEEAPDEELDASVDGALADVDDQRAVFEILAKGQAADDEGLQRAMLEGLREDGKFVPPLMLLAGELAFPFDELETLRATAITVAPLAGADEPLKAALETAQRFLATPDLACAPAVAEGMIQRIREAWAAGKRVVPAGYLEAQTERMLLEQRRYQRRTVFGGPQLRGLLHLPGGQSPVPAYVPAQAASKLPLYQRFRVRLVATGHVAEDQNEAHSTALKVLAFARVAPAPGTTPATRRSAP